MFLTVCESSSVLSVINFVKALLEIVTTIIPIVLIIMISIDISKIVINTDDKSVKEATKKIVSRSVAAIVIFLIPMLVNLVTDNLGTTRFEESKCWTNATVEKIAVYRAQEKAVEQQEKAEKAIEKEAARVASELLNQEREKRRQVIEEQSKDINNFIKPYFQGDYSNEPWPGCSSMARCACGPTSVAVVATAFRGAAGNDPVSVKNWVCARNNCGSYGSGWGILDYLRHIGLNASKPIYKHSNTNSEIMNALRSRRQLVIVLVHNNGVCDTEFTTGGHYFVLSGIDSSNQISIVQVSSRSQTSRKYDINHITKCLTAYSIIGEN